SSVLMEKMGTEGVYVHYNTNVLFSGEYLNFKLYSLGKTGQAPLLLSKFAYVELIDVEGERVMIEKVKMIDGQGQGDFFIPTTLESGYYSLVAYTNYMRNWESSTFYKDQLLVINPYTNNQHVFWKSGVAGMDSGVDSVNNQYVSGYSYSLSN